MAELRERVAAETENIEEVLSLMPSAEALRTLSDLELAGAAALIHSFYNGVENILKQLVSALGADLPQGPSWHKDLVELARRHDVLSAESHVEIRTYVAFRHFFAHGYAFNVDPERIAPLVAGLTGVYAKVRRMSNAL
jgi:uncharacterized protein YutE (UPF0331/DUF86 family)